jgi:hypothetical protein
MTVDWMAGGQAFEPSVRFSILETGLPNLPSEKILRKHI